MYENETRAPRALLIAVDNGSYDTNLSLGELSELAEAAGAEVVGELVQKMESINNSTYIGSGKIQEVIEYSQKNEVNLLIFDDELSGMQMRNLEETTKLDVIDRTMLILDIFALRARSSEGKLQVELAQQKYLLPRLIGMGKKLSRQQGGIGSRGPGESKLESDRRHIRRRIEALERELLALQQQRKRARERRAKNDYLTIAIVGYTNVGKSTLLNLLTDAGVLAKDQLFATLDPTARELRLENGQKAMLVDTVGLLRRLPHQLIKAFHSTLEEAAEADLILNICDASSDMVADQISVTKALLEELGCGDIPVITVYNKIDLLGLENDFPQNENTVFISAKEQRGIDKLLEQVGVCLAGLVREMVLEIPYSEAGLLDRIRRQGRVLSEEYRETGVFLSAMIDQKLASRLEEYRVK